MAIIKKVNTIELEQKLTSIADTLRLKKYSSDQLNFPNDFIEKINDSYTQSDWIDKTKPSGIIQINRTGTIPPNTLAHRTGFTKLFAPNITYLDASSLRYCSGLQYLICPKLIACYTGVCTYCSALKVADFGGNPTSSQGFLRPEAFLYCSKLKTLILRGNTVWTLSNISNFNSTPFASGKAGGTLYVPRDLIESYKIATNWSTILNYTKSDESLQNQILPIEDSEYYTHYGDGTLLPNAYESSTGKLYLSEMEIDISKEQFRTIPQVLDTYGTMENLVELTLTGTAKCHTTGALLGIEGTFSTTKYPNLKKLYIQPTQIKSENGQTIKEYGGCGHYIFSETNLTDLVIGKVGGPYFSGGGYFRRDFNYKVGSEDGLTITVYVDPSNQYLSRAGFQNSTVAPNTTVICIDYTTGEEITVS